LFLVPCARLSWPSRQLLSARKYTVPYRISYRIVTVWNFVYILSDDKYM